MSSEFLAEFVVSGDAGTVEEKVKELLLQGEDPVAIINEGLLKGMNVVGERFKNGEMFVPEVLMSARALNVGMDLAKENIQESGIPSLGSIVIGTVKGDLHDIGKSLVSMMLESSGFKVIDLGVDVTSEQFLEAAKQEDVKIIAMSAMLTTTMENMKEVIQSCKEAGIDVSFMVGGAPVTAEYAEGIGANYASDSSTAVEKARDII